MVYMALTKEQKEKIAKLKKQMEEKNQERKEKEKTRKKQVHNKIVVGALALKYSGLPLIDDDFIKKFETFLKDQEQRGKFFSSSFSKNKKSTTAT